MRLLPIAQLPNGSEVTFCYLWDFSLFPVWEDDKSVLFLVACFFKKIFSILSFDGRGGISLKSPERFLLFLFNNLAMETTSPSHRISKRELLGLPSPLVPGDAMPWVNSNYLSPPP